MRKTYILAVSGGVDSMVLLDLLASGRLKELIGRNELDGQGYVVAHFDHGIRPSSKVDRLFVEAAAKRYGLPFVYESVSLGPDVSEARARQFRYQFLERVRREYAAEAIVTAHHQDDVLETAILNILRGTGWRGLVALRNRETIRRPLLFVPKKQLLTYAQKQQIAWREDHTNSEFNYRRNYVRHRILTRFDTSQRDELLHHIHAIEGRRIEIDTLLHELAKKATQGVGLNRAYFISLPYKVSGEFMAYWLRKHDVTELNARLIERLVVAAKTYTPGRTADIDKDKVLHIEADFLKIAPRKR